jgi:hypothetical protein
MIYLILAYSVIAVVLTGYGLSLYLRSRRVSASLDALSDE